MFDLLRSFTKHLFTGRDNQTFDIGRLLWFQGVQAYMFLTAYSIYKGGAFDPMAWGGGLGAVLGAGAVAIGLKANAEPLPGEVEPRRGRRGRDDDECGEPDRRDQR